MDPYLTPEKHSRNVHEGPSPRSYRSANPLIFQWARQASNLGPTGYEPAALTN